MNEYITELGHAKLTIGFFAMFERQRAIIFSITGQLCKLVLVFALTANLFLIDQADSAENQLGPKTQQLLDTLAANDSPLPREPIDDLFREATLDVGDTATLLKWLSEKRKDTHAEHAQPFAEIEAQIAYRRGDLDRSLQILNELLAPESASNGRLDLKLWRAKLYDATGKITDAETAYQELAKQELSDSQQKQVRLRLALMGLIGNKEAKQTANANELIELANKSKDIAFRNRAAIVLAVQNKFADAVKVFTVQGDGTARFRNACRLTEWAIRANQRDKAIENGWIAVRSTELKRNRRYALALLVEAYRLREKEKGLNALVEEFAKQDEQRKAPMSDDMRRVWIDLLRELGRYDDAIQLFKSSADGTSFTIEMRRELLEMEGEAGNQPKMIDSYRQLIATEPHEILWRGGLTRVFLEQGKTNEALALWQDYIPQLNNGTQLLESAQTLGELGLDALAEKTIERMVELKVDHGQALLYLSDLRQRRGQLREAEEILHRLNEFEDVGDVARAELAAAFERLGRQDKSVEVIESIRKNRVDIAIDLEMRLAWLYSETGNEEEALNQWKSLWRKINSVPRRRYVEDRLMTVASRLGTLADIAVDLEEKLMDGKADEREAGLLVRIYSRVQDSVAASEILEEYMTQSGQNEVERLQEKGRIYQVCNDYWNYEKVVERLIEVDPEGKTEYLRQLALSMLERGKAQEARDVLITLRGADDQKDSIGGEFEAGVLSLVGMNREAADSYRQAIAKFPDRIESYLLLANQLKTMGEKDLAVGMFQYLAENAERDDLFTIAIDGLLNMESGAPVLQWARRITLERLAGREDKNYLYQLLADLSAEVRDKDGQIRALENSLAVSDTRRLSVLRECMDLSSKISGGSFYQRSTRTKGNAGNKPFFAFGRRLIALGELMPPQVFLDLGQAFLADGDLLSAERTFGMARHLADQRSYERNVASIFEISGHRPESLSRYDRLLRTSPSDVALIARVAKLNEQQGKDDVAARFYEQGLNLLLAQTPLTTQNEDSSSSSGYFYGGNRDAYQTYSDRLLRGLLVTLPDNQISSVLENQRMIFDQNLQEVAQAKDGRVAQKLSDSPRLDRQSQALRRLYFSFDRMTELEDLERTIIRQFAEDDDLITQYATERISFGQIDSARRLLDDVGADIQQRKVIAAVLGEMSDDDDQPNRKLSPEEMWRRLMPSWNAGDRETAKQILRRVDQTRSAGPGSQSSYMIVNGVYTSVASSNAADIVAWIRLALELNDEGLALQFARGHIQRLQRSSQAIYTMRQTFETFREILPPAEFNSLVKFTVNLIKDNEKLTAVYLWLVSEAGDQLGDLKPSDESLLEMVEERGVKLSYFFTFDMALEVLPESIRDQALASVIDGIEKNMRPRELVRIALGHESRLSPEISKQILAAIQSGIEPALKDSRLRYVLYYIPLRKPLLQCQENADLALAALDLMQTDRVRSKDAQVAEWASYIKGSVLHELGRTEESLKIAIENYGTVTDSKFYYSRNAKEWLLRNTIESHPERFLESLDAKIKDGKRTIQQTDERLKLVKQTMDVQLLREAYDQAWKDHPKQPKYVAEYERWEQQSGRIANAIAIKMRLLTEAEKGREEAKEDAAKNSAETKIAAIHRQLGELWYSNGHMTKGLEHWRVQDELDIAKFEEEIVKRAEEAKKTTGNSETANADDQKRVESTPTEPKNVDPKTAEPNQTAPVTESAKTTATQTTASTPADATKTPPKTNSPKTNSPVLGAPAKTAAAKPKVSTPHKKKTVNDLRTSMESKEKDEVEIRTILRELWRAFPAVVESPYAYYGSSASFNNLVWPADTNKKAETAKTVPTIEERLDLFQSQRQQFRKGLSEFLAEPVPAKARPIAENAWQVLSTEPIALAEMKRLIRSRTPIEVKRCGNVIAALLAANIKQSGDDAVFESLMEEVKNGAADHVEIVQLFALLKDNPNRILADDDVTINALLRQLDLDQIKPLSQLAWICGKIGRKDQAAAAYTQCALRAGSRDTDQIASFTTLLAEAGEVFSNEELMALAEKMFAVVPRRDLYTVPPMLDLRMKLLSMEEVRKRSDSLFRQLDVIDRTKSLSPQRASRGAEIYAKTGDFERAAMCLKSIFKKSPNGVSSLSSATHSLPHVNAVIERVFPEDGSGFEDYRGWLKSIAAEFDNWIDRDEVNVAISVKAQLIIAYRQTRNGAIEEARETLSTVDESLQNFSITLQLLAIDVNREAGRHESALALQKKLYDEKRLSHVRFGDFLRDTAIVDGNAAAKKLVDELLALSEDEELLKAASELAPDDSNHINRFTDLQCRSFAALYERELRRDAAADRMKIRSEWKKNGNSTNREPAGPP